MSFVEILKDTNLPRRSGKTVMLAMHYVQLVLDNPGKTVEIEDHHISLQADRDLFVLVRTLLDVLRIDYKCDPPKFRFCSTGLLKHLPYPSADLCIDSSRKAEWARRPQQGSPTDDIIY